MKMSSFRGALLGALTLITTGSIHAATYYVSPSGNNNNAGTLSSPWRTIQKAANVAVAGDTVLIRAGTYRETVTPTHSGTSTSPITYQPYNNETVVINGADIIAGTWSPHSGAIYQAGGINWDLGVGLNQVFLDGEMIFEARWPNTIPDVTHPIEAHVTTGGEEGVDATLKGIINDANLEPGLFVGAMVVWGGLEGAREGVISESGVVTDSTAGQIKFTYHYPSYKQPPAPYQPYYLFGKLTLLDTGGEWFYDDATQKLYVQTYSGAAPTSSNIQMKRRVFGFDLSGRSYINLKGLKFFATTLKTDALSNQCIFDGLDFKYVSHFSILEGVQNPNIYGQGMYNTGVMLYGTNHQFINNVIAYSAGNGLLLQGSDHYARNNVIHDVNYFGSDCAAIATGTQDYQSSFNTYRHIIENNTLYNSARALIIYRSLRGGIIVGNECYNALLRRTDTGAFYVWNESGADGTNWTEIAYNVIHDIPSSHFYAQAAIYHDSNPRGPYVKNYAIHHNLAYNVPIGYNSNDPGENHKVYNNTFVANNSGVKRTNAGPLINYEIKNTLTTKGIASFGTQANNIANAATSNFVDATNHNYQLAAGSSAIDAGTVLAPYTNGYLGSAPDVGAFEFGRTRWLAGSNLALNENFEIDFLRWTTTFGAPTFSTSVKHGGSKSFVVNQDQDAITYNCSARLNRVASLWFYDDASRTTTDHGIGAFVDDGTATTFLGVSASTSASNYVYRFGATTTASSVMRTTGWHQLEFDYRSGNDVKLFIDGTLVAISSSSTAFNRIAVGDFWTSGSTGISGYFDDIAIGDELRNPLTGTTPFFDSFESGFSAFDVGAGTPSTSTAQAKTGSTSYWINEDREFLEKSFSTPLNSTFSVWFYDHAADTTMSAATNTSDGTNTVWLGVSTSTSATNYVYRNGASFTPTAVPRSTGWHRFEFDCTTGTNVKLRIDGTLVATLSGSVTAFNKIGFGDYWADDQTSTAYFDAMSVSFSESFESGFDLFTIGAGTPSTSTAQAKTGSTSYWINEDREFLEKSFSTPLNSTFSVWFYDHAADTTMSAATNTSDGTNTVWLGVSTSTSATNYVYRNGASFTPTAVPRSTGWHRFEFDCTTGTNVKLRIDGTLVATLSGSVTAFNKIGFGDYWVDGQTGPTYFDTLEVK